MDNSPKETEKLGEELPKLCERHFWFWKSKKKSKRTKEMPRGTKVQQIEIIDEDDRKTTQLT